MNHLILSCSLSATSNSAVLAERLAEAVRELKDEARLIDLRQFPLPFIGSSGHNESANVVELRAAIRSAAAVVIATPIHNYEVGGVTRNALALGGEAWNEKVVGFLCAAGGQGSYMAVMGLANSLMLDFRCIVVPRFVYATGACFRDGALVDPKIEGRITELAGELRRVAGALWAK